MAAFDFAASRVCGYGELETLRHLLSCCKHMAVLASLWSLQNIGQTRFDTHEILCYVWRFPIECDYFSSVQFSLPSAFQEELKKNFDSNTCENFNNGEQQRWVLFTFHLLKTVTIKLTKVYWKKSKSSALGFPSFGHLEVLAHPCPLLGATLSSHSNVVKLSHHLNRYSMAWFN